jgi:hypothetical protein
MSALGMASLGVQCEDKALGMASLGVFCVTVIAVPKDDIGKKSYPFVRHQIVDEHWTMDQIQRDDEEVLAVIVAAVKTGIIK